MSTAPHLNLLSPVLPVDRRDFYMDDPTLLNPNNANPIIDGEWLSLDTTSGKLIRGSGTLATMSFQVFSEKGRYDTQPIGKVTTLFLGGYEAETDVYTSTGLAINSFLVVGDVTVGGLTKKGLIKLPTASGSYLVVGSVTKLPTGKVRYVKFASPWLRVVP
jgi:hypothetical protein